MQKPLRRLDAGYMTASFYPRNQKFLLFTIDSTHASIYDGEKQLHAKNRHSEEAVRLTCLPPLR
jgi:hypothetical protein